MVNYKDCCYECGTNKYKIKLISSGITTRKGICPFCQQPKMLIPATNWVNYGV